MYNVFPPDFLSELCWPDMSHAKDAYVSPKYRVSFIYDHAELVNLAASMAFAQGTTAAGSDPAIKESIHQWFDIEESHNAPIIQLQVDLAMSEIEHAISAVGSGHLDDHRSMDGHLHPKTEYAIEIWASSETQDGILSHLEIAIRQYIIETILSKWAALTYPDGIQYWEAQRAQHIEDIRSAALHCQPKKISVRRFPAW